MPDFLINIVSVVYIALFLAVIHRNPRYVFLLPVLIYLMPFTNLLPGFAGLSFPLIIVVMVYLGQYSTNNLCENSNKIKTIMAEISKIPKNASGRFTKDLTKNFSKDLLRIYQVFY